MRIVNNYLTNQNQSSDLKFSALRTNISNCSDLKEMYTGSKLLKGDFYRLGLLKTEFLLSKEEGVILKNQLDDTVGESGDILLFKEELEQLKNSVNTVRRKVAESCDKFDYIDPQKKTEIYDDCMKESNILGKIIDMIKDSKEISDEKILDAMIKIKSIKDDLLK